MLSLEGLSTSYGDAPVLHDVSLEVPAGGTVALMGRNGVGKTTLLKTIMGLLPATSGRIRFDGDDITRWSPDRRARRGLGYVPQGREIFPYLTVEENLRLGRLSGPIPPLVFDLFPKLRDMLGKKGGVLSGGEQQQLALGRVLAADPKLVLLDEPTEGIQPSIVQQIESVLAQLKTQGRMSFLLVEQYVDFALRLTDGFYIMEKGTIVSKGVVGAATRETIRRHVAV